MPWSITVFLIVAMTLAIPLYALHVQKLKHRRRKGDSEREERLERELAQLRDRVETLERIVTDRRYDLDREFENLGRASRSG